MPTYTSIICKFCNDPFNALPRDKNKQFCNNECRIAYKSANKKIALINCMQCNNILSKGQYKFCSHSCSAIYSNAPVKGTIKIELAESIQSRKDKLQTYFISYCKIYRCHNCNKNYASKDLRMLCKQSHKPTRVAKVPHINQPKIIANGDYSKLCNCTCKFCKLPFVCKSALQYCNKHRLEAANKRAIYKFKFNVFNYPTLFDLNLLTTIGFYGPGGKSKKWNMCGLSRDHKVSIADAITHNYDPYIISHPMNCELMPHSKNNSKKQIHLYHMQSYVN